MALHTQSYRLSIARERPSFWTWALLWWLGVISLLAVTFALGAEYFTHRFSWGVRVGEISLDQLTYPEAEQRLREAYRQAVGPPIEVRAGEQVWFLYPEEVGYTPDLEGALAEAYRIGREGTWLDRAAALWQGLIAEKALPIPWRWQPGSARLWLNRLVAHLYRPWAPPAIVVDGQEILFLPGRAGQVLQEDTAWTALKEALDIVGKEGQHIPLVELKPQEVSFPQIDPQSLESAVQEQFTSPLLLRVGDGVIAVDPAELRLFVRRVPVITSDNAPRVEVEVDKERLHAFLTDLNNSLRRPPVNARLDYDPETNQFIVLTPSLEGWEIDVEKAVEVVSQAIASGKMEVDIPVTVLRPQVPMDASPEALGIREVIGEGVTSFRGSSPARVANIVRAAEALRGVVIPPGEVFSFNAAVGAITAANGYEDSLIIWGDRTAVGIGGGVCQVSTTLFRAAFFAGLPIVERWNHGYIVSWYGEPGLDATVYSPYVDLKFQNTTDHYILIQPVVDVTQGTLTFRLWGTDPGWEVEVSEPVHENVQEPPPPVYQEDPTLPPGTVKQVEWAKPGMTVRITRTVRKGDTVIERREFVSTYQPWRAVYLYGPGTIVP